MIAQYRFSIEPPDSRPVSASQAYPLYAWLLAQVPAAYSDALHRQGEKPISQYLCVPGKLTSEKSSPGKSALPIWTVSCLNEEAYKTLEPVLQNLHEIPLHSGILKASLLDSQTIPSIGDLTDRTRKETETPFFRLSFCSPTAFKHDGQYVIFPEEHLLIQSLAEKWDRVFPAYPLHDVEMLEALEAGVKIVDYRLHSCRFPLKNVRIPGFIGQITIQARLVPPLMEVWKSLVYFSAFSGIGIKTTLGMGGIQIF